MAKIVIEIPGELKGLGDAITALVARVEGTIAATGGGKAVDYARVERAIAEHTGLIDREANRGVLQSLDIDVPAIVIGKVRYTRVGRCEAAYYGMAGAVDVERSLYREAGKRGGDPGVRTVDPVSLRAGVVADGWLPHTARVIAHEVQKAPSRDAVRTAQEYGRLPYSRASFERVAHVVGALMVADHQDIEDVLIDAYEVPSEARSISVSLDRVSVPIEVPVPRPKGRPRKDAPKKPVKVDYQMAYCGTVSINDKSGDALHVIRYGCMPEGDELGLRDRLVSDVATLLSKRPLEVELLCDGAPELWNLLNEWFTEANLERPIHRLVDFHHAVEKLGAAARVIDGPEEAGARVGRWRLSLLNRETAAPRILAEIEATNLDEGPGEDHPVHAAITYLRSNSVEADRMNYARARKIGLPIGSGNVEATCKSLFGLRLKRCGSRWKHQTGEHIVQLRALALSDRWGPAVELLLRPLSKPVRVAV